MNKITGWVKCPMCDGKGEIEDRESLAAKRQLEDQFQMFIFSQRRSLSDLYCDDKEYSKRKASRKMSREKLDAFEIRKTTFEPCPSCKDQKFKGCLPIYSQTDT